MLDGPVLDVVEVRSSPSPPRRLFSSVTRASASIAHAQLLPPLSMSALTRPSLSLLWLKAKSLAFEPNTVDIYTNSWGPSDDGQEFDGPGPLALE